MLLVSRARLPIMRIHGHSYRLGLYVSLPRFGPRRSLWLPRMARWVREVVSSNAWLLCCPGPVLVEGRSLLEGGAGRGREGDCVSEQPNTEHAREFPEPRPIVPQKQGQRKGLRRRPLAPG